MHPIFLKGEEKKLSSKDEFAVSFHLAFTRGGASGRVGQQMRHSVPAIRTSGCFDTFGGWRGLFSSTLAIAFGALTTIRAARAASVDFDTEIAPILIKRCSECHGPDQQKAKLRLDSRAATLLGGKSEHPAISPGHPDQSELIKRVTTADPDEVMPPKGPRLTEREVAALRQWIQEGATWPEVMKHWAFVKPERPGLPPVSSEAWPRNEIDRFVLARLDKEGLSPQKQADRYTLARRLYLDLIGLPPSWAEVQAFVKDTSPRAYEKLVDGLLSSPHYGEQMARGWLDLAR